MQLFQIFGVGLALGELLVAGVKPQSQRKSNAENLEAGLVGHHPGMERILMPMPQGHPDHDHDRDENENFQRGRDLADPLDTSDVDPGQQ